MLAFPAFSVWDAACHSLFALFIDFLFFFLFSVILSAWTLGVFSSILFPSRLSVERSVIDLLFLFLHIA